MLDLSLIAVLCLIWGATWLAIKIGLEDSPPFLSAGFRFLLSCIILSGIVYLRKLKLPTKNILPILIPGFFTYFLSYSFVYWGEQHIGSGLAAVLFSTLPFFVAIFAHLLLDNEKLSWIKFFSLTIGFAGILVIFSDSLQIASTKSSLGIFALLGSAICTAFSGVLTKKYLHHVDPVIITLYQMAIGTLFLLVVGFSFESLSNFKITIKSIGALLYLVIFGSVIAFITYFWLLKRNQIIKLSLIAFVTPVIALLLGWIIKSEKITVELALGTFLVILGIVSLNFLPKYFTGSTADSHQPKTSIFQSKD